MVRRFSERYQVAMLARNAERLDELSRENPNAHAFPCDVADTPALQSTLASIRSEFGVPTVVVHNAVDGAFGDIFTIDPSQLDRNFQVNTMTLLHLAQAFGPDMLVFRRNHTVVRREVVNAAGSMSRLAAFYARDRIIRACSPFTIRRE